MNASKFSVTLWLMIILAGCAGMQPLLTGDETVSGRSAETIARVETGLTIAYNTITQEAERGIFTKSDLTAALENLDKAGEALSKAQQARRSGLFETSLKEALQSERFLSTVQTLLAERIKKRTTL